MGYFVNKSFEPEKEMKTFGKKKKKKPKKTKKKTFLKNTIISKIFPQIFVIHTVKDCSTASEAEADVFF